MGRATVSGPIPYYQGRGLAIWPSPPTLPGTTSCTSPTVYQAIRQEYFTYPGTSAVDSNCINANIKVDSPLRVVMHVTADVSAASVYNVATGSLIGQTSWASGHSATNGTGLVFAAVCNPSGDMDGNCFYKEARSASNRPFKVEITEIQTGWF